MKLLLWACILYVAFAKKRFHFPDEKFLSSGGEDYSGNRYPLNPSLNIPYPTSDINFASPFHPSENKIPNYPGNPDPDSGVPSYPWLLNPPGALPYHSPSFPITTWLVPSPPLPQKSSLFGPPASGLEKPFYPINSPMPTAAEPYIATPLVATPLVAAPLVAAPLVAAPTTSPNPKPIVVEPGPFEPDEAEPAASEHRLSTFLD